MELPVVYTIEEAAQLLKTDVRTVQDEIQSGQLQAFKLGGEWRTTDRSILDFISMRMSYAQASEAPSQRRFSRLQLQRVEAFQHKWPGGDVEEYPEAYEGIVDVDNKQVAVRIGICERDAAGRTRKRVTVFLDGRPTVEFAGADDFDKSQLVASVITLPNRKRLKPRQAVPDEYRSFRLARYDTVVIGPRAASAMAVVAKIDDFESMVSHAVIRAMYRDQL